MSIELIDHINVQNTLGESPVWDERTGHLWWVDIQARLIYRYDLSTKTYENFAVPERACALGLTTDIGTLIIGFETGFALFDYASGVITWLARPEFQNTGRRFNDGRVDRQGRFWAGSMVEDAGKAGDASAALYCLANAGTDAGAKTMMNDIMISNGLCWSPDASVLYFADSPRHTIFAYDFDKDTGAIANKRIFATTAPGVFPDGSDVDAQGYIWNAEWGGKRVVRYGLGGAIDHILDVPVTQPTCIAFGGKDMNVMFVTTARDGLSAETLTQEPQAGNVLIYQTDITGLPALKFRLSSESLGERHEQ
ncbi:MAG: SMP-30/gluconolactonase/LRE family protein [Robiginitomaculum sp.]|nr:SMP-30/gluconolactonase/LRE family protein [Robiginitomaculum sp.]